MSSNTNAYVSYSPLPSPLTNQQNDVQNNQIYDTFRPVLIVQYIFGRNVLSASYFLNILAKLVFLGVLSFMVFVFCLAVLGRGDTIGTWTQLSIYIIPLLTFPCGAKVFHSDSYYRLLSRTITDTAMVRFFVSSKNAKFQNIESRPPAHNRKWLKQMAMKSLLFPLSIEFVQWGGFLAFSLVYHTADIFVGKIDEKDIDIDIAVWNAIYGTYWILSIYLVAFIAFQFVFVTRLIVKDTVSLMSLFGNSSFLHLYPVYRYSIDANCCFRIFEHIGNFLTMDLFASVSDEYVYSDCAKLSRDSKDKIGNFYKVVPRRVITSPTGLSEQDEPDTVESPNTVNNNDGISPAEASEVFTIFIAEVEELTSCFTLFTFILTFFGVANLITHVCLFVQTDYKHINYWTFFRTILFLWVAVRMLLCVHQVSTLLGKLPAHIKFIRTLGRLAHGNSISPSWSDFLELLDSFNLGKRSFGFPLTLRQVASIATFLNMAFLIVLSVFKSKVGGSYKSFVNGTN